jgi:hypothetical protein
MLMPLIKGGCVAYFFYRKRDVLHRLRLFAIFFACCSHGFSLLQMSQSIPSISETVVTNEVPPAVPNTDEVAIPLPEPIKNTLSRLLIVLVVMPKDDLQAGSIASIVCYPIARQPLLNGLMAFLAMPQI